MREEEGFLKMTQKAVLQRMMMKILERQSAKVKNCLVTLLKLESCVKSNLFILINIYLKLYAFAKFNFRMLI